MKIYAHKNGKVSVLTRVSTQGLLGGEAIYHGGSTAAMEKLGQLADVPGISETPKANGAHVAKPSNEVLSTHKEEKIKTDMEERPESNRGRKHSLLAEFHLPRLLAAGSCLLGFERKRGLANR